VASISIFIGASDIKAIAAARGLTEASSILDNVETALRGIAQEAVAAPFEN